MELIENERVRGCLRKYVNEYQTEYTARALADATELFVFCAQRNAQYVKEMSYNIHHFPDQFRSLMRAINDRSITVQQVHDFTEQSNASRRCSVSMIFESQSTICRRQCMHCLCKDSLVIDNEMAICVRNMGCPTIYRLSSLS